MLFRTGKDIRRGDFGVDELPIDLCMECKEEVKNFALGIKEKSVAKLYSEGEVVATIEEQEESGGAETAAGRERTVKADNNSLKAKIAEYGANTKSKEDLLTIDEHVVKVQTERDTYKTLYEGLFERILQRGAAQ